MAIVKAVLFDLDGTLVDSLIDIHESFVELARARGWQPFSRGEVLSFVGQGFQVAVGRALAARGVDPDTNALLEEVSFFSSLYEPRASLKTRPFDGAIEALAALRRHFRLAVVTNKPTLPAKSILGDLGLAEYFDVVLGGDWGGPRKPSGEALVKALDLLGLSSSEAVMVGDSDNDILAARAAGVRSVAVSFGYSVEPAAELGADRVIGHFSELADVIGDFSR